MKISDTSCILHNLRVLLQLSLHILYIRSHHHSQACHSLSSSYKSSTLLSSDKLDEGKRCLFSTILVLFLVFFTALFFTLSMRSREAKGLATLPLFFQRQQLCQELYLQHKYLPQKLSTVLLKMHGDRLVKYLLFSV